MRLDLGLTDEQRAARKLGGSDAKTIMSGDDAAVLRLWEEKTGRREPDDLSGVLAVMMGHATEEFNRFWFEKQTGQTITREGESLAHPDHSFMTATLDGVVTETSALFEAKHVGGFEPLDKVIERYQPQVHHVCAVAGLERATLSIFVGNSKWEMVEIALDEWYLAELMDRERAFWAAVQSGEPPVSMPAVAAPVAQSEWRTVDMTGSNEWASLAADWLEHRDAAKTFEKAAKGIKGLIDADVGEASGHGITAKRAKNNALSIKEMKA